MTPAGVEALLARDRLVLIATIAILFVLAGLYTVAGVGMDMSAIEMTATDSMSPKPGISAPSDWPASLFALVFLMWWVMMIAMMLPSVAPTILLYAALLRKGQGRPDHGSIAWIAAVFLTGYLLSWAGFSVVATAAQWWLERIGLVSVHMMSLTDSVAGAAVLIAAGVYQFTPLKTACLRQCRSPVQFLVRRKRPGRTGALMMGLEHGAYCLGCCWFLMALLFAGGIMNLYWIVAIAVFVAVEKLTPHGHRLARITGAGLVIWGGAIMAVRL